MKLSLISVRSFDAKGKSYTVASFVSPSKGSTHELFVNAEQAAALSRVVPAPKTVEDALANLPEVDVDFNERGRIEDIYLPK